jgi:molybdopterin synthase sulfur carrier subunit
MKLTLLAFGIAKEIFGSASVKIDLPGEATVAELKSALEAEYPALKKLSSCLIAVNSEYAEDSLILRPEDEIALIPPVSGG